MFVGINTLFLVFFFNDTATTEIYTLSLHDALPISANSRENFPCLVRLSMLRKPSRAFGKVQHAQSQHHAGDGCETKHPSPPAASGKRVVNDLCGKDSDRDRELE